MCQGHSLFKKWALPFSSTVNVGLAFVNFPNFVQAEQFRSSSLQYSRTFIPVCQRSDSSLTACLGEELGESIDFSSLGLIALTFHQAQPLRGPRSRTR